MARPTSGKYTISGTRNDDTITVGETGFSKNGSFTGLNADRIDAGIIIKGGAGVDTLAGGRGPDDVYGGAGNDVIAGGGGIDKLLGEAGNDTLSDDFTGAFFDGGRGIDLLDFSGSSTGVAIYSADVETNVSWAYVGDHVEVYHAGITLEGRILNFEAIFGSGESDVIWGDSFVDEIRGGAGDDYIAAMGYGSVNDRLFGDAGNDLILGNLGDDQLTGGTGYDRFVFSAIDNNGQDLILDYTPNEDTLAFLWGSSAPNWAPYSYNSLNDSLIGTYGSGSSVIIVGISDAQLVSIELHSDNYIYDYYI